MKGTLKYKVIITILGTCLHFPLYGLIIHSVHLKLRNENIYTNIQSSIKNHQTVLIII